MLYWASGWYDVLYIALNLRSMHAVAAVWTSIEHTMPTYKLYYFNMMGGPEVIRWIFYIQAGVPFEDIRLTHEEWIAFKPKTPHGGLPVLDINGKLLAGRGPIQRYLAEEYDLAGSSALENAEIASNYDVIADLLHKIMLYVEEKDEARKMELKKDLLEKHFTKYLGIMEKKINDNGSPQGWTYGSKVTYPDFCLTVVADMIMRSGLSTLEAFPAILKLKTSVETLPNIAKWIREPKTEF